MLSDGRPIPVDEGEVLAIPLAADEVARGGRGDEEVGEKQVDVVGKTVEHCDR